MNANGFDRRWYVIQFTACLVTLGVSLPALAQLPAPWRVPAERSTGPGAYQEGEVQPPAPTYTPNQSYSAGETREFNAPVAPASTTSVHAPMPPVRSQSPAIADERRVNGPVSVASLPTGAPLRAPQPEQNTAESTLANSVPTGTAALNREEQFREELAAKIRLEDWFPQSLRTKRFLIADYQWISLLAVILLGMLADIGVRFAMHHMSMAWFRIMRTQSLPDAERKVWRPVGLLAQALVWYAGTSLVNLPDQIHAVLTVGVKFFGVWIMVWTVFQWIDILASFFSRRASMTSSKFDDLLVPLVTKSLKIFTICMGLLSSAQAFHLPVTGLIGGLGLSGAALAFASKDAISNLFGSLTVLVDRPFEIGDWIITDGVEGTVEQVGFRSTRVRTFHNSQISVPNSTFTTAVVDNMGRRHYQRIKSMLAIAYGTTTEQIDAFCEGIRELIRNHPYTRKEHFHIYFHEFGPTSLDIMLNFFLCCPDRPTELQSRHELFMDIIKLARALDISFAAPNQKPAIKLEDGSQTGKVLEFKQPAAVGRHEATKVIDQRASRGAAAVVSARRFPESA